MSEMIETWPPNFPVTYGHLSGEQGRGNMPDRLAANVATVMGVAGQLAVELPAVFDYSRLRISSDIAAGPPNRITASSLNEYGPRTLDAVILTGTNKLLEPITDALAEAVTSEQCQQLEPARRLQTYAALISGVAAAQPILIDSGLKARSLQRSAMDGMTALPLAPALADLPMARCEIPQQAPVWNERLHPRNLDLIDTTVPLLSLERDGLTAEETGNAVVRSLARRLGPSNPQTGGMVEAFRKVDGQGRMAYSAIIDHRLFAQEVMLDVYPEAAWLLDEFEDPSVS